MEINKAAIITFTSLQMIICIVCCYRGIYVLFRKYFCNNNIQADISETDSIKDMPVLCHRIHPII
jgi:hypothetical protein